MPEDLAYINARLKGMHSRMLQPKDWVELNKAESLEQLFSLLQATDYQSAVEETRAQGLNLATLDRALSLHWQGILDKLAGFIEGKPALALQIELWRLDLLNLLRIAGRLRSGKAGDREAPLYGTLSAQQIEELEKASSWREMARMLTLWHHPLAETVASLKNEESPFLIETVLQKGFFEMVQRRLAPSLSPVCRALARYWSDRVDQQNLRAATILRELPRDISPQSAFIPGGRLLTMKDFLILANPDILEHSRRRLLRYPSLRYALACKNPAELERTMERRSLTESARTYRQEPLGIGVLLAYLLQEEAEIANLRLIGRSIEYGLDPETVKENLLVPGLAAH
ncbi:MAG: V-type ATPase subunit [Coprothermobacterota bacterium]|nr:V-type ATPase subunit [Coprothermobacterota bacterium]